MISVIKLRHLYNQAKSTDSKKAQAAISQLAAVNEELRAQANKQYRSLRRSQYAYGNAYDYATGYIVQRYGDTAVSFYKQRNVDDIYEQSLTLRRLLADPMFDKRYIAEMESRRFAAFAERGLDIKAQVGEKRAREFLRFLGNSGAGDYLDVFSAKNSWQAMEQLFDIFSESEEYREKLSDVFADFQLYLETAEKYEDWEGMSYLQVRDYVEKTYEDIKKRRR